MIVSCVSKLRLFDYHMTGISRIWKNILFSMAADSISIGPMRLGNVDGYLNRSNELVYHSSVGQPPVGCIIFFGGDMQDYKEKMLAHRDNQHYSKWDLESTAVLLHNHFPQQAIIIVKPAKMSLMTFSCYENFVNVNNFGAPTYEKNIDSLKHLKLLLSNTGTVIQKKQNEASSIIENNINLPVLEPLNLIEIPLTVIGFSKGCVVLNQFLYSFQSLQEDKDDEVSSFVNNISSMYWLEGGHSGCSSTWVTDKNVLHNFSTMKMDVHIHVTPYQIFCDTRPRIGREEKIFRENLCRMGMNVSRTLHFESEPRSLEKHFEVLEVFKKAA
ncbi:UPF0565 protein C2orf69 homolog [Trichonephila clavata]|uniref:UPF0565 protein C2orf69 homolog n=1 Tax=Trichonephila clavata TaxID=2740835 RepID=A0A8X6I843_TRICU|nr:UPF0565 protein C2orf69 homolog [Trichonephila clavata]